MIICPSRTLLAGALLLAGGLPGSVLADVLVDAHREHTGYVMHPAVATEASAVVARPVLVPKTTEALVRKVDTATGRITLKHGPIVNLDMPAMTMVFRASKPKLLEGVKAGDAVRFRATMHDGAYTVTSIEVVR